MGLGEMYLDAVAEAESHAIKARAMTTEECKAAPIITPYMAAGGHPKFKKLLDQMWELHCKKAADYGVDEDPLQNIRAGADLVGIPHWQGAMLRANDKVVRIRQFIRKGKLENEGVEDSLQDLAAYALLALVLLREAKK